MSRKTFRAPWPKSASRPVVSPLQASVVYASEDPDALDAQYEGGENACTAFSYAVPLNVSLVATGLASTAPRATTPGAPPSAPPLFSSIRFIRAAFFRARQRC